jgi:hypothetical protein
VGNAVPVQLAYLIAKNIKDVLDGGENNVWTSNKMVRF